MKASEYNQALLEKVRKRTDVVFTKHPLDYKGGSYEFVRIASGGITIGDKVILLRAGIHGDEVAGPLTILKKFDEIIDYIHQRGMKVIIYPLGNPSGFEHGLRYNIDGDRGEREIGNNDFCRYVLRDGKIVDDMADSSHFTSFKWSSSLWERLPLETGLMHDLLKHDPLEQIVAVLDLHQDYIHEKGKADPAAYHYAFGDLGRYQGIVAEIKKIIPVLGGEVIGAGQASPMKTDADGFIVRHDGSLPALMCLLGTNHCITVETTGRTPEDIACSVNMIWIKGIVDLISAQ